MLSPLCLFLIIAGPIYAYLLAWAASVAYFGVKRRYHVRLLHYSRAYAQMHNQ